MEVDATPSAVILAGGLGTRRRGEGPDRPKVLAEVGGHPFLLYLLEPLQRAGLRHVVLATGFAADQVSEVIGSRRGRLEIEASEEERPLGTGGALRLALPLLRSETCLVMNGDSACGLDPVALLAHHHGSGLPATMGGVHQQDTARFGQVLLGEDDRITGFREKDPAGGPGWINAGIYVLSRDTIAAIPSDRPVSLEREVFGRLVAEGMSAFRAPGPFLDIGTRRPTAKPVPSWPARALDPWGPAQRCCWIETGPSSSRSRTSRIRVRSSCSQERPPDCGEWPNWDWSYSS